MPTQKPYVVGVIAYPGINNIVVTLSTGDNVLLEHNPPLVFEGAGGALPQYVVGRLGLPLSHSLEHTSMDVWIDNQWFEDGGVITGKHLLPGDVQEMYGWSAFTPYSQVGKVTPEMVSNALKKVHIDHQKKVCTCVFDNFSFCVSMYDLADAVYELDGGVLTLDVDLDGMSISDWSTVLAHVATHKDHTLQKALLTLSVPTKPDIVKEATNVVYASPPYITQLDSIALQGITSMAQAYGKALYALGPNLKKVSTDLGMFTWPASISPVILDPPSPVQKLLLYLNSQVWRTYDNAERLNMLLNALESLKKLEKKPHSFKLKVKFEDGSGRIFWGRPSRIKDYVLSVLDESGTVWP